MRVRAIKDYFDKQLNLLVKAGEEIEAAEDRAKVLTSAGVAELVAETTTPTTEKVAKQKSRKKHE